LNVFQFVNVETPKFQFQGKKAIRAADAKEVGVGNPAEETYRYPNQNSLFIVEFPSKLSMLNP